MILWGLHRVYGGAMDSKIILVKTHNGKRPFGTVRDVEVPRDPCQEVERELRWIKAGPHRREMVWNVYFDCGRCKGIIYTGIVKRVDDD